MKFIVIPDYCRYCTYYLNIDCHTRMKTKYNFVVNNDDNCVHTVYTVSKFVPFDTRLVDMFTFNKTSLLHKLYITFSMPFLAQKFNGYKLLY